MVDFLTNALTSIMPFRGILFSMLGATEVSILMQLCKLSMTTTEMRRFMAMSRDFGWMMDFVNLVIGMGMSPYLVGSDLQFVMRRISDPMSVGDEMTSRMTTLWFMVASNRNTVKMPDSESMMAMFTDAFTSNDAVEVETINDNRIIVRVNGHYPTRIIIQNLKTIMTSRPPADPDFGSDLDWRINGRMSFHTFEDDQFHISGCIMTIKYDDVMITTVLDFNAGFNTIRNINVYAMVMGERIRRGVPVVRVDYCITLIHRPVMMLTVETFVE